MPLTLIVVSPAVTALALNESVTVKLEENACELGHIEIRNELPRAPGHLATIGPLVVFAVAWFPK